MSMCLAKPLWYVLIIAVLIHGPLLGSGQQNKVNQLIKLAETAGNNGQHDLAIKYCNEAIEIDSENSMAYNLRGAIYSRKGNPDQAIQDFSKAIELAPDYTRAYEMRGKVFYKKGEYNQSIQDYEACIKIEPLDEYAIVKKLPCLIRLTNFNEAASWYDKYKSNYFRFEKITR